MVKSTQLVPGGASRDIHGQLPALFPLAADLTMLQPGKLVANLSSTSHFFTQRGLLASVNLFANLAVCQH